jgi:hypothetical protein
LVRRTIGAGGPGSGRHAGFGAGPSGNWGARATHSALSATEKFKKSGSEFDRRVARGMHEKAAVVHDAGELIHKEGAPTNGDFHRSQADLLKVGAEPTDGRLETPSSFLKHNIGAGGSGSGRHKGGGKNSIVPANAMPPMHNVAVSHGFKRLNKSAYLKPVKDRQDSVFVNHPKNTWEHRTGSDSTGTKGSGYASLDQHLSSFYKK